MRAPGVDRQRRQVEAGRPALGAPDEVIDLRIRQPHHTGSGQERACCWSIHGEMIDPDLDHAALRPEAGHGNRYVPAGSDRQLRTFRKAHRQLGDHVEGRGIGDRLGLVEHQQHRVVHPADRRGQPGHFHDARAPGRQRPEHTRLQAFHAVERGGDVDEEHGRVVVPTVEGHPPDAGQPAGPLREQRGLAVARRSDDGNDRGGVRGRGAARPARYGGPCRRVSWGRGASTRPARSRLQEPTCGAARARHRKTRGRRSSRGEPTPRTWTTRPRTRSRCATRIIRCG